MIGQAIESVLAQTYTNWELIIVDDGSTDNTEEFIQKYARNDQRIKYNKQENKGESTARNNGILKATGDFVFFLDDDDYYLKNFLMTFYLNIKQNGFIKKIYRSLQAEEINGKIFYNRFNPIKISRDPLNYFILKGNNLQPYAFPRKIIEKIQFEDKFVLGEDFHFLIRAFLEEEIYVLYDVLCVYRNHESSTFNEEFSLQTQLHKTNNRLETFEDLYKNYSVQLKNKKIYMSINNLYNKYLYFYSSKALKKHDFSFSIQTLRKIKWERCPLKYMYYIFSIYGRIPIYYFIK
jgi:glycosyltransferase involved in cell wall biosynthesis